MARYSRKKRQGRRARRIRSLKAVKAREEAIQNSISNKPKQRKKKIKYTSYSEDGDMVVGRAILSLACILSIANSAAHHSIECKGHFKETRLVKGNVEIECDGCARCISIPVDLGITHCSYEKALTLSVFASGTGLEALNTTLSTLTIPELSLFKYQKQEERIFVDMHAAMQKEFELNAKEEYRLAMEAGDFFTVNGQKIPFITVVVDGGWNKRSFGHRYDSKAGVAVIIGARTKKILFMDWRIKTCAKCSFNKRNGKQDDHRCFQNWDESAQSMEADIIVAGFRLSFEKHGLIYKYMIGDADSSVFFKVKSAIHYPGGHEVEKMDCVNHAMRCLTSKLHGIAKNTAFTKTERDTVSSSIARMTGDARGAINYNSTLSTSSIAPAKLLYDDLTNIPRHVYGDHTHCKSYFCKVVGQKQVDPITTTKIYTLVQNAFCQMAQRADRIVHNVTSNLAEGFMSQVCKYTSGKRCNQTQRYGYPLRAMAALFSFDHGPFWVAKLYKEYHQAFCAIWDEKFARSLEIRHKPRKKRVTTYQKPKPVRAKTSDYGPNAPDSDIDPAVMQAEIAALRDRLKVSTYEEQHMIQLRTIGQAYNPEWKFERRHRITASNCGKIFRMRESTNSAKCIQAILYPVDLTNNENVRRGIDFEPLAKRKYEEKYGESVTDCGLFVSIEEGILAASPDGLIGKDGILEIKCTSVCPSDLCTRKDKILILNENGQMYLNRKHAYFYQVVMQLYVSNRSYCDFVIYYAGESASEDDIWRETIHKNIETDTLWQEMKKVLVKFFVDDLAPEIIDPCYPKGLPIRQPLYRIQAAEQAKLRRDANKAKKRPRTNDD